jgi:hypothetical protein
MTQTIKVQILKALEGVGPVDIYDLSDLVSRRTEALFRECQDLRSMGMIDWMYPEDEMSISDKGRASI